MKRKRNKNRNKSTSHLINDNKINQKLKNELYDENSDYEISSTLQNNNI